MSTPRGRMDLQHFSGIALELSAGGLVLASNGHLEAQIGRELIGHKLSTVLDESSQQKWRQLLTERQQSTPARP